MDDALFTARLAQFANSSDYDLVSELLRLECERAEAELLKTDIGDPTRVLANHVRAQSFRALAERVIKRIEAGRPHPQVEPLSEREVAAQLMQHPERFSY